MSIAVEQVHVPGRPRASSTPSGNTGNALPMVAAVKGCRMLVIMPHGLSAERRAISRAFGADLAGFPRSSTSCRTEPHQAPW